MSLMNGSRQMHEYVMSHMNGPDCITKVDESFHV